MQSAWYQIWLVGGSLGISDQWSGWLWATPVAAQALAIALSDRGFSVRDQNGQPLPTIVGIPGIQLPGGWGGLGSILGY